MRTTTFFVAEVYLPYVRFVKTTAALTLLIVAFSYSESAGAVTFDWATVGNPGNPGELQSQGTFGGVDYTYRISKHEVTNDQYTEFLNAVDATGTNPNTVYSSFMTSDGRGGIDYAPGNASGSKYSSKADMGNKPVNYVSFFDSMRFVNWLENGQPTDGSGTESGVYTVGSGVDETRSASASFFIPSEDEWYKAAYYDPRVEAAGGPPGDDHYWLYPTSSDAAPTLATANATGDISNPGINVADYFSGADWNGLNGNVTSVGSAGAGSASFYGTFDQGGNVWEWNEAVIMSDRRGLRGADWSTTTAGLRATSRIPVGLPTLENSFNGFRVASAVPEPSTALLGAVTCLGLLLRRFRCKA